MSTQTAGTGTSPRMVSHGFTADPWPVGTHTCLIFNDDEERRWTMARFVQSGLDANEMVGYFVDTVTPEELKQSLRELGVVLPDELDGRQYSVLDAESAFCPDGTFKVGRMLESVAELHRRSIREGYVGARGTGEMTWATKGHP